MATAASRRAAVPPEDEDIVRCLAFVNTLSGRSTASPSEGLADFEALCAWAAEAGVLDRGAAERLAGRGRRRPADAAAVVAHARELRELLHEVLEAQAAGRSAGPAVLDGLSGYLSTWYAHGRLTPMGASFAWTYAGDDDLDRIVWEVARAAARLVTSPRLARVRACEADTCRWWFLDDTKNGSRRWCDMKICGNREKARRHRARARA